MSSTPTGGNDSLATDGKLAIMRVSFKHFFFTDKHAVRPLPMHYYIYKYGTSKIFSLLRYGQHPVLCHPLGIISSETGVQQGDPLGLLLFSLVLHKVVSAMPATAQNCCSISGILMMAP